MEKHTDVYSLQLKDRKGKLFKLKDLRAIAKQRGQKNKKREREQTDTGEESKIKSK